MDALIANPARMRILLALAGGRAAAFAELRQATRLTDGNLASHARRLSGGGLVQIDKLFADGKPRTEYRLTEQGLTALRRHVDIVTSALAPATGIAAVPASLDVADDDQWVD